MAQRGFTLVELVAVIVILGILSVMVLPRFFDTGVYRARGFYGEVKAALRHAQKRAIAANCPVNVTIVAGTSYSAAYDATCPGGVTAVPGFNGGVLSGNTNGVALVSTASPITFDAAGRSAVFVTVTVGGSHTITVHDGTGYVDGL